jgi:hypothetical protein
MMLSLVDQLLVTDSLLRGELRIDLGAHVRLDGIEPRPNLRPQRVGFGPVAREDRAHRVPLCVAEIQLAPQILDHRVGAAPAWTTMVIAFRRLVTAPPGKPARGKHSGKQADGGEFWSIQHDSSFSFIVARRVT